MESNQTMNTKRETVKQKLLELKQESFKVNSETNIRDVCFDMLSFIGDVDPVLRDEYIYEAFYNWLIIYDVIDHVTLKELCFKISDEEHLFLNISSFSTDDVFMRSFSVLILSVMLNYQSKHSFLDKEEFNVLKNKILRYVSYEKDVRGYVEDKGWAHSMAHGADALKEIVLCNQSTLNDHKEILKILEVMLCNKKIVYTYKEDERMANVLLAIINRNLVSTHIIKDWLSALVQRVNFSTDQITYAKSLNIRNFLYSFYFKNRNINLFDDSFVFTFHLIDHNKQTIL